MCRKIKYFIYSGSNMYECKPIVKRRTRRTSDKSNTKPEKFNSAIDQPKACTLYYIYCAIVNRQNGYRQTDLNLEIHWLHPIDRYVLTFHCWLFVLLIYCLRILVFFILVMIIRIYFIGI